MCTVAFPIVEQEKIATEKCPLPPAAPPTEAEFETTLRDRFEKPVIRPRFDRAMDILDRYGEEEGLRRLKDDDPDFAEQLKRQRDPEEPKLRGMDHPLKMYFPYEWSRWFVLRRRHDSTLAL